ncbi:unnamed protein product, partial [Amoebophrya sp. A120]
RNLRNHRKGLRIFFDAYKAWMTLLADFGVIAVPEVVRCNEVENQIGMDRKQKYVRDFLLFARTKSREGCPRGYAHPGAAKALKFVRPGDKLLFKEENIAFLFERQLIQYHLIKSNNIHLLNNLYKKSKLGKETAADPMQEKVINIGSAIHSAP